MFKSWWKFRSRKYVNESQMRKAAIESCDNWVPNKLLWWTYQMPTIQSKCTKFTNVKSNNWGPNKLFGVILEIIHDWNLTISPHHFYFNNNYQPVRNKNCSDNEKLTISFKQLMFSNCKIFKLFVFPRLAIHCDFLTQIHDDAPFFFESLCFRYIKPFWWIASNPRSVLDASKFMLLRIKYGWMVRFRYGIMAKMNFNLHFPS